MTAPADLVFLLDCDNTLLDNDRFEAELREQLDRTLGRDGGARYWNAFEALRTELGYADYLGALQRCRRADASDAGVLLVSQFLLDYPFASRLCPGALDVLRHLDTFGPTVILSDGDVVFQPRKLRQSGLWTAVAGRVLIYIHKETALADVVAHYPARHYVMIDDKVRVLAAMKGVWGDRLTTIFPRQGHYATDPKHVAGYPPADVTVERIGDLVGWDPTGVPATGP